MAAALQKRQTLNRLLTQFGDMAGRGYVWEIVEWRREVFDVYKEVIRDCTHTGFGIRRCDEHIYAERWNESSMIMCYSCFEAVLHVQDFPYNFAEGMEHHNLWSEEPLTGDQLAKVSIL